MMEFIKELHEARMTKGSSNVAQLTYTDCGERMYLLLLALEVMRLYPAFRPIVQRYAKSTVMFDNYKYYLSSGTDLYNFIYFLVGDDSAQAKLKDPQAAAALKQRTRIPLAALTRHIQALAQGREPSLVTKLFIDIEGAIRLPTQDYKKIRRGIKDFPRLTAKERQTLVTRLIFAVRAKLRSSDFINSFEKFATAKNLENPNARDPEPELSTPDVSTSPANIALYRYLVGPSNIAQTKRFLDMAKNGNAVSAEMLKAYIPVIDIIDDIVQGGPAYVQNLKALHNRAKKRN